MVHGQPWCVVSIKAITPAILKAIPSATQDDLPWFLSGYAAAATDGTTVYPTWIFDGANQRYAKSASPTGTVSQVSLSDFLTVSRSSKGWAKNSIGEWVEYANNQLRFHYFNGRNKPCALFEGAATNFLLNSRTPATQTTGSLAVGTYVLWVEGSGTATTSAGTAVGTGFGSAIEGAYNKFTITTAGTVTVTVTGTLTVFQLEQNRQSSFIETQGTTVTRSADVCNTSDLTWLNATQFTIVAECEFMDIDTSINQRILQLHGGNNANRINMQCAASTMVINCGMITASTNVATSLSVDMPLGRTGEIYGLAYNIQADNLSASVNGGYPVSDTSATLPTVSTFAIGNDGYTSNAPLNGGIYSIKIYPKALSAQSLQNSSNPLPDASEYVDTVIVVGQSNADGRGENTDLSSTLTTFYSVDRPNLRIWYKPAVRTGSTVTAGTFAFDGEWWKLNSSHNAVNETTHQTIGNAGSTVAVESAVWHGLELKLGYNYYQAFPQNELCIVKAAVGGSTIEGEWGVSTYDRAKLYAWFRNYVWYQAKYELQREGKIPRIIGVVWMQGETDANNAMPESTYAGYLQDLVDLLNSELNAPIEKIIIGGLSTAFNTTDGNAIKAAQQSVASANANTVYLPTDGTGSQPAYPLKADNLHYNAEGLEDFADGIAQELEWSI